MMFIETPKMSAAASASASAHVPVTMNEYKALVRLNKAGMFPGFQMGPAPRPHGFETYHDYDYQKESQLYEDGKVSKLGINLNFINQKRYEDGKDTVFVVLDFDNKRVDRNKVPYPDDVWAEKCEKFKALYSDFEYLTKTYPWAISRSGHGRHIYVRVPMTNVDWRKRNEVKISYKGQKVDLDILKGFVGVFTDQYQLYQSEDGKDIFDIDSLPVFTDMPKLFPEHVPKIIESKISTPVMQYLIKEELDQQEPADSLLRRLANEIDNNDSYSDWIRNGYICFNEGLGLDVWEAMSKRSNGYQNGMTGCTDKWKTFTKNETRAATQASWWAWLKKHKPARFHELNQERCDFWDLMEQLNHHDVAKYFYNLYPTSYIYNENMGWFSLNKNNVWETSKGKHPVALKSDISNTMKALCMEAKNAELTRYTQLQQSKTDSDEMKKIVKEHERRLKIFTTSYKQLGSNEFIKGVIAFLDDLYRDTDLENKMDMNRNVFAFTDGLFDLRTDEFRPIKPDDFVSTTTGYEYPKQENYETRRELEKFMHSLFHTTDVSEYLWDVLTTCIMGTNRFQEFYTLTGSGGNGKSVLAVLLSNAFGNYYQEPSVTNFTKPRERVDQPLPEMFNARPKRLLMTKEPEASDKLQTSLIKSLTGGDKVSVRNMRDSQNMEWEPQFTLILQTNSIPQLSKLDGGIERRLRIIKFPFQFNGGSGANCKPCDPDLKDVKCTSKEWRDQFILMLCNRHKQIKSLKSLTAPTWVTDATSEYVDDNNPMKAWLNEKYDITHDTKDVIKASELKAAYLADTKKDSYADAKFKYDMTVLNKIEFKRTKTGVFYIGLKRKQGAAMDFEEDPLE